MSLLIIIKMGIKFFIFQLNETREKQNVFITDIKVNNQNEIFSLNTMNQSN